MATHNTQQLRLLAALTACFLAIACTCAVAQGGFGFSSSGGVAAKALVVIEHTDWLDALAREPMVVQHPDGPLFVTGYGEPGPKLWKSRDEGKTWTRVNVGTEADGAIGNSDVDLAVAPDGTMYFVTMGFDRKALEGTHIAIGVSKDVGATWKWTMLSKHRFDDRPWVKVTGDGTAHVIWNDGSGVNHSVSQDGGTTWVQQPQIYGKGGSSHLATGPHREVAVRITPASASGNKFDPDIDLIAVSADGGVTWKTFSAPGHRLWNPDAFPDRWVEPIAWDAEGALYSFWADGGDLWLGRSDDRGEKWASWKVASGNEPAYFPYLIARRNGELGATWFSGQGDTLKAHVARIEVNRGDTAPTLVEAKPFQPESYRRESAKSKPGDSPVRQPAGEYFPILFLRDGGLGVVSTIQNSRERRLGFEWIRLEMQQARLER